MSTTAGELLSDEKIAEIIERINKVLEGIENADDREEVKKKAEQQLEAIFTSFTRNLYDSARETYDELFDLEATAIYESKNRRLNAEMINIVSEMDEYIVKMTPKEASSVIGSIDPKSIATTTPKEILTQKMHKLVYESTGVATSNALIEEIKDLLAKLNPTTPKEPNQVTPAVIELPVLRPVTIVSGPVVVSTPKPLYNQSDLNKVESPLAAPVNVIASPVNLGIVEGIDEEELSVLNRADKMLEKKDIDVWVENSPNYNDLKLCREKIKFLQKFALECKEEIIELKARLDPSTQIYTVADLDKKIKLFQKIETKLLLKEDLSEAENKLLGSARLSLDKWTELYRLHPDNLKEVREWLAREDNNNLLAYKFLQDNIQGFTASKFSGQQDLKRMQFLMRAENVEVLKYTQFSNYISLLPVSMSITDRRAIYTLLPKSGDSQKTEYAINFSVLLRRLLTDQYAGKPDQKFKDPSYMTSSPAYPQYNNPHVYSSSSSQRMKLRSTKVVTR